MRLLGNNITFAKSYITQKGLSTTTNPFNFFSWTKKSPGIYQNTYGWIKVANWWVSWIRLDKLKTSSNMVSDDHSVKFTTAFILEYQNRDIGRTLDYLMTLKNRKSISRLKISWNCYQEKYGVRMYLMPEPVSTWLQPIHQNSWKK